MLKDRIDTLARITWNGDTRKYLGDSFLGLIRLICLKDATAGCGLE